MRRSGSDDQSAGRGSEKVDTEADQIREFTIDEEQPQDGGVIKLPRKQGTENGVDKRKGLLYALKQRLENYNSKNQKCYDETYEAFVKGQLNNLKEA